MTLKAPTQPAEQVTAPVPLQPADSINEYEDAEENYDLRSPKFWIIIMGMYLVIFLVALVEFLSPKNSVPSMSDQADPCSLDQDRSIIATAIPRISDEFKSIQEVGWYGSAYTLACACFNVIAGRAYQLYSTKGLFLLSILVFEAGSVLCGAAPSSITFIIGRAIAGLGSAFIISGGMMILQPFIPLRKRPVFVSLFGLSFGVASVTGPILGGLLTDYLTWRWCFYINLPIGGFTMLAVYLLFDIKSSSRGKLDMLAQLKRLDPIGVLFFIPSMVSLLLALQWGGSTYSWSAPTIIGLFVSFGALFTAFILVEIMTPETAMAPMRVVLNRSVAGSILYMFLASGGVMSVIFYQSYWFQTIKATSATQAGIRTFPLILPFVLVGIAAAMVTQKIRFYAPAMLFAPIPCSIGAGLLSTLSPGSGPDKWVGYQFLFGFGMGCGYQNAQLPPQNVLPRADVTLGMGLIYFAQQLGGAVFLAVSQNVLSSTLVHNLSGIAGLDVQAIINTGATDLRHIVPSDKLDTVISVYNHALTRIFVLAAALTATMIVGAFMVEWKKIRANQREHGTPDAQASDVEA